MKEDTTAIDREKSVLNEKMGRRDFFANAGKLVIPTIGIIGLSLSGFPGKVAAAGCSGCASACTSCTGSCSGTCDSSCVNGCTGACSGLCTSTAK